MAFFTATTAAVFFATVGAALRYASSSEILFGAKPVASVNTTGLLSAYRYGSKVAGSAGFIRGSGVMNLASAGS